MTNAIAEIRQSLTKLAPEIGKVLPEHVSTERFERITLTALQRSPDLLGCDRNSLFESVMACAQDGLIPDGREAALTKFGNKVAYMPMVAGILKKIRQSGEIATLTSQVVYDSEVEAGKFRYWNDDQGEHIYHEPDMLSDDPGKVRCVYAMARTKTGESYVEVLRLSDVEKIRKASRSADKGPWSSWWTEMARKSAIRRLSKRLPMSTDLERVVTRDDQFYPDLGEREVTPAPSAPTAQESVATLTGGEQTEPEPPPRVAVLFDSEGAEIGQYQKAGSYLNAMDKAIDEAADRETAQALWKANADTIERIAGLEKHEPRVAELSEKVAGKAAAESRQESRQEDVF